MTQAHPRYPNGRALLSALAKRRGVPMGVHLQVADRCNHACQHCYQIQGLKGELELDEVRAVIDDLATQGVMTLNVSGGEATLRHDLVDILSYARNRGFAVRLFTNAFLIDDALADRLAKVGLYEVHVSVYSSLASEHDAITRVPGSHARTLAGIGALRARGVRVVIKSPMTSVAEAGSEALETLAASLGCELRRSANITPMEDGSLATLDVAADPARLVSLGVLTPWHPEGDPALEREAMMRAGSCGVGRSGMVVLPNGDVLPCTDTPLRLANVREGGFAAALRADEMEVFRSLSWSQVHGCRDCDLMPACARCHATALHEGGDYLGPYATACARARARYEAAVGEVQIRPPAAGCETTRTPSLGPYRIEAEGVLRPVPHVRTREDDALAARHPWIRGAAPRAETLVPASRLTRVRTQSEH